ncbi:HAD family hydrolase [Mycolicibacterium komossense]|uniref:HAD-IA family hydrolase n=1 Tax=Mycolicibacterium komossense TaxID=1779 RepID=A0ABT3CNY8_9MYCO|nr:HAD-IA family hydrolase [Mycolicibacterium komossense]MCV7230851.1 HAD-IA family hydrolase [Mycolicibacterium komossense]
MLRAVIFDVDGTVADTERHGHLPAFNAAFAEHRIDIVWSPEEYGQLLHITGGRRRIAADLRARGFADGADELAAAVHRTKTRLFRERILTHGMPPRPGLVDLVTGLRAAGIRMAVATTGTRTWVEPLLQRTLGDDVLDVVVTGDDVRQLKPHPEVYRRALDGLGLPAASVLAVEDSAVGLQAACAAGVATVVVTNEYTVGQEFPGADAVLRGFDGPEPLDARRCRDLHRQRH